MIITLRPNEKQSEKIEDLKRYTGQSTSSKAIFEAAENYIRVSTKLAESSMQLQETKAKLDKLTGLIRDKMHIETEIAGIAADANLERFAYNDQDYWNLDK